MISLKEANSLWSRISKVISVHPCVHTVLAVYLQQKIQSVIHRDGLIRIESLGGYDQEIWFEPIDITVVYDNLYLAEMNARPLTVSDLGSLKSREGIPLTYGIDYVFDKTSVLDRMDLGPESYEGLMASWELAVLLCYSQKLLFDARPSTLSEVERYRPLTVEVLTCVDGTELKFSVN